MKTIAMWFQNSPHRIGTDAFKTILSFVDFEQLKNLELFIVDQLVHGKKILEKVSYIDVEPLRSVIGTLLQKSAGTFNCRVAKFSQLAPPYTKYLFEHSDRKRLARNLCVPAKKLKAFMDPETKTLDDFFRVKKTCAPREWKHLQMQKMLDSKSGSNLVVAGTSKPVATQTGTDWKQERKMARVKAKKAKVSAAKNEELKKKRMASKIKAKLKEPKNKKKNKKQKK
jgi:hypothetical protein